MEAASRLFFLCKGGLLIAFYCVVMGGRWMGDRALGFTYAYVYTYICALHGSHAHPDRALTRPCKFWLSETLAWCDDAINRVSLSFEE